MGMNPVGVDELIIEYRIVEPIEVARAFTLKAKWQPLPAALAEYREITSDERRYEEFMYEQRSRRTGQTDKPINQPDCPVWTGESIRFPNGETLRFNDSRITPVIINYFQQLNWPKVPVRLPGGISISQAENAAKTLEKRVTGMGFFLKLRTTTSGTLSWSIARKNPPKNPK